MDNFQDLSWNSGVTDFSIGGILFARIQRTRETCSPERLQHQLKGQGGRWDEGRSARLLQNAQAIWERVKKRAKHRKLKEGGDVVEKEKGME